MTLPMLLRAAKSWANWAWKSAQSPAAPVAARTAWISPEAAPPVDLGGDGGGETRQRQAQRRAVQIRRQHAAGLQPARQRRGVHLRQHRHQRRIVRARRRHRIVAPHGVDDVALDIAGKILGEGRARDLVEPLHPLQQRRVAQIALRRIARRRDELDDAQGRAVDQRRKLSHIISAVAGVQQQIVKPRLALGDMVGHEGVALEPVRRRQLPE